ncbi:hypothetical protein HAP95_04255 [Acidithiobacillus sp. RW2]|uniref:Membrane transporter protein n=1 Tax=Acidithiobacillus sulfurivorans TaxID=1958756 RepID=A0ABS5ZW36_9PROT|nr:hypothetical protein [Acidithiobacillus sulfurivorans]
MGLIGGSILAVPLLLYRVGVHNPHLVIGTMALAVCTNAFILEKAVTARQGLERPPVGTMVFG